MARSITLTLGSGLGANLGPNFNLTANVGVVIPLTATLSELLAGKIVDVDDLATQVTITSTGVCTNSVTQTIPCAGTTTTTSTTSTTTTIPGPTTTSTTTTTTTPLPTTTTTSTTTSTTTPLPTTTTSTTTTSTTSGIPSFQFAGAIGAYANSTLACANKNCFRSYWKGPSPSFNPGDIIYDNAALTIPFNGGGSWYAIDASMSFCAGTAWRAVQIDSSGVILNIVVCP